jgi:hypothetical protein
MNRLPFEQQLLLVIQAVALVGLCARLAFSGLYRKYRYFFGYVILSLVQAIFLPFFQRDSVIYLNAWMVSEALAMSAYTLVVLETYTFILRDLPGIATAARRFLKISLSGATIASLLLVALERTPTSVPAYFMVCERTVITTLLVFVLSSLAFLVYYPVPLSRNVVNYSIGFAVYLLTKAMTFLIVNLRYPSLDRLLTATLMAVAAACPIFWLLTLSPEREEKTVSTGQHWSPDNEKGVLSRLRAINDNLARTGKKRI